MRESAIDSLLIRYAGIKSANDIADMTGLEPEDVVRRTQELLASIMLSPEQLVAKNIFQLMEIAAAQFERFASATDEDVARLGNTAAGAVGRIQGAVEKIIALQKADYTERDAHTGHLIAKAVSRAADRVMEQLGSDRLEASKLEIEEAIITQLVEIAPEVEG
jgi:hypothetical protein